MPETKRVIKPKVKKTTRVPYDQPLDLDAVYEALKVDLEDIHGEECIERTTAAQTRKGYDTTGYKYSYIVDRLNTVVGLGHWIEDNQMELVGKKETQRGGDMSEYKTTMTVRLGYSKLAEDGYKFITQARASNYGGHVAFLAGDAMKGARTNAFKKTVADFGLGLKAYHGTIDEDATAVEETPKTITVTPAIIAPAAAPKIEVDDIKEIECPTCGNQMALRAGIGKQSGKPYKAYFCTNRECEQPPNFHVKKIEKEQVVEEPSDEVDPEGLPF